VYSSRPARKNSDELQEHVVAEEKVRWGRRIQGWLGLSRKTQQGVLNWDGRELPVPTSLYGSGLLHPVHALRAPALVLEDRRAGADHRARLREEVLIHQREASFVGGLASKRGLNA
jgi:hypothetical protein